MRFNKSIQNVVMVATLLAVAPSFAQVRTGFLGGGTAPVIATSAGNYNFTEFNAAQLQAQILQRLDDSRKNDRLYVMQTVEDLNEAFRKAQADQFQKLMVASTNSNTKALSYADYVMLTQAYISKRMEINALIGGIVNLPTALRTSTNGARAAGGMVELGGQLSLNLGPVVEHYNEQLGQLDGRAQALSFKIQLPNGSIQQVDGINGNGINKADLIDQAMLDKLSMDVRVAKQMVLDRDAQNVMGNINKYTLNMLTTYINNQGKSERWRLDNAGSPINMAEIRDITDTFWLRSYVRTKFGMPLGGIGINYKKRALHLDQLLSRTNLEFVQGLRGTAELNTVRSNMESAVSTYQGRVELTKNPYELIGWAVTRLKGKWNEAEANLLVINMLMADLQEEHTIIQGGGLAKMRDIYKTRYQKSPAMKGYFRNLGRNFEGLDQGAYGDVGIADATTLRGIYASAKVTLNNVLARQEKANRMEASLNALMSEFATINKSNQRTDDLLN